MKNIFKNKKALFAVIVAFTILATGLLIQNSGLLTGSFNLNLTQVNLSARTESLLLRDYERADYRADIEGHTDLENNQVILKTDPRVSNCEIAYMGSEGPGRNILPITREQRVAFSQNNNYKFYTFNIPVDQIYDYYYLNYRHVCRFPEDIEVTSIPRAVRLENLRAPISSTDVLTPPERKSNPTNTDLTNVIADNNENGIRISQILNNEQILINSTVSDITSCNIRLLGVRNNNEVEVQSIEPFRSSRVQNRTTFRFKIPDIIPKTNEQNTEVTHIEHDCFTSNGLSLGRFDPIALPFYFSPNYIEANYLRRIQDLNLGKDVNIYKTNNREIIAQTNEPAICFLEIATTDYSPFTSRETQHMIEPINYNRFLFSSNNINDFKLTHKFRVPTHMYRGTNLTNARTICRELGSEIQPKNLFNTNNKGLAEPHFELPFNIKNELAINTSVNAFNKPMLFSSDADLYCAIGTRQFVSSINAIIESGNDDRAFIREVLSKRGGTFVPIFSNQNRLTLTKRTWHEFNVPNNLFINKRADIGIICVERESDGSYSSDSATFRFRQITDTRSNVRVLAPNRTTSIYPVIANNRNQIQSSNLNLRLNGNLCDRSSLNECNGFSSFRVKLNNNPVGNVTVRISQNDADNVYLTRDKVNSSRSITLTFNRNNWNTYQEIFVFHRHNRQPTLRDDLGKDVNINVQLVQPQQPPQEHQPLPLIRTFNVPSSL